MFHILKSDHIWYYILFYSSLILDGGGTGGGHLRRPGLRPQGGGGKATQSRPRECHRPHDLSR